MSQGRHPLIAAEHEAAASYEIQRLQTEVEALRHANHTLEQQIGVVTGMMDTMMDEVSRKSRELEERNAEQVRLSAFVANVMDTMDSLLLVLDRFGKIRQANASVRRSLGIDPAELIDGSPDNLLVASTLNQLQAASPAALRARSCSAPFCSAARWIWKATC